VIRAFLKLLLVALAALLALWAFLSYLQPAFSGDRAGMLLICS